MARKIRIVGGLIALSILAFSLCAAPASLASSRISTQVLRCPVVKRTPHGVIVKVQPVHRRLAVLKAHRYVRINGQKRFEVVRRARRFITLRTLKPPSPHKPPRPTTPPIPSEPTPTPTPTPTATPTPTVTPTPTATPTPASAHPSLILDQTQIDRIKARIAAGTEPEASAFRNFLHDWIDSAMTRTPSVFAGPYRGVEDWSHVFDTLNQDGATARDLALAYAFTGDVRYAARSRLFLLAWALGNTPTTQQDAEQGSNANDIGYHQSYGAFSFAYAYDLTYNAGVYSAADRAVVKSYFTRFVDAIKTSNDKIASDWYVSHPEVTMPYKWDATKFYHRADSYIGGDAALSDQTARLAMAGVIGYDSAVNGILNDTTYPLSLARMLKSALTPINDGDGVAGHPVPAPHAYVYLGNSPGRGGMFDYMTYNTRSCSILVAMARNLGWSPAQVTAARTKLHATWTYMARFFGPNAEPNFNPLDVVNLGANLPRFTLAYNAFGDQRFLDVMNSGDRVDYYEPQFLGPITVTHSLR